ncbi:MAG: NfeD family protein [Chloroflexi bacterium]|nr:NfeD family protein [Chloroflexota bacterium]
MPIAGLGLFFVLPWPLAVAGYVPIAVTSMLIYHSVARALRLPVQTGREAMLGAAGEVVCQLPPGSLASYLVRCRGEIWRAGATEKLRDGDRVRVSGFEGGLAMVERLPGSSEEPQLASGCHRWGKE